MDWSGGPLNRLGGVIRKGLLFSKRNLLCLGSVHGCLTKRSHRWSFSDQVQIEPSSHEKVHIFLPYPPPASLECSLCVSVFLTLFLFRFLAWPSTAPPVFWSVVRPAVWPLCDCGTSLPGNVWPSLNHIIIPCFRSGKFNFVCEFQVGYWPLLERLVLALISRVLRRLLWHVQVFIPLAVQHSDTLLLQNVPICLRCFSLLYEMTVFPSPGYPCIFLLLASCVFFPQHVFQWHNCLWSWTRCSQQTGNDRKLFFVSGRSCCIFLSFLLPLCLLLHTATRPISDFASFPKSEFGLVAVCNNFLVFKPSLSFQKRKLCWCWGREN